MLWGSGGGSLWPPLRRCRVWASGLIGGRQALGPCQKRALVSNSLICPRGLILWIPQLRAVPHFLSDKQVYILVFPIPEPQLSQYHPSELSITFLLCSPHHCPHLPLKLLHLPVFKCHPPQLALTPRLSCLSQDFLLSGWVGS